MYQNLGRREFQVFSVVHLQVCGQIAGVSAPASGSLAAFLAHDGTAQSQAAAFRAGVLIDHKSFRDSQFDGVVTVEASHVDGVGFGHVFLVTCELSLFSGLLSSDCDFVFGGQHINLPRSASHGVVLPEVRLPGEVQRLIGSARFSVRIVPGRHRGGI